MVRDQYEITRPCVRRNQHVHWSDRGALFLKMRSDLSVRPGSRVFLRKNRERYQELEECDAVLVRFLALRDSVLKLR